MGRILRCAEMGSHCDFLICGQTSDDVLKSAVDHMRDFHKKELSKDLYEKARDAIHEADCEKEIQTGRILVY